MNQGLPESRRGTDKRRQFEEGRALSRFSDECAIQGSKIPGLPAERTVDGV